MRSVRILSVRLRFPGQQAHPSQAREHKQQQSPEEEAQQDGLCLGLEHLTQRLEEARLNKAREGVTHRLLELHQGVDGLPEGALQVLTILRRQRITHRGTGIRERRADTRTQGSAGLQEGVRQLLAQLAAVHEVAHRSCRRVDVPGHLKDLGEEAHNLARQLHRLLDGLGLVHDVAEVVEHGRAVVELLVQGFDGLQDGQHADEVWILAAGEGGVQDLSRRARQTLEAGIAGVEALHGGNTASEDTGQGSAQREEEHELEESASRASLLRRTAAAAPAAWACGPAAEEVEDRHQQGQDERIASGDDERDGHLILRLL
mmetsp:Transcript_45602/g.146338  ORF Transcript_45602/g.146338 Transcript_45602/m.146338 type:complete len:317 (+) Transcript_45602:1728-2678(+)